MSECKHPGCPRDEYRIGYCMAHRNRFRLGKDMDAPIRVTGQPEVRFWAKVDKTAGCWNWTGTRAKGYGNFRFQKKMVRAHRLSFEWANGPIPDGLLIDHTCHNPACVNPDHLRLATKSLNGQNRAGLDRHNTSGFRGVSWNKHNGAWEAFGQLNGKQFRIGRFHDVEEADRAITAWRKENMPYSLNDQKEF